MKLTNKFNLPEPLVNAVKNQAYSKGSSDITVTQLIQPPLIRHLNALHHDKVEEDASSRIWALLGSSVHSILEKAYQGSNARVEERVYAEVNGWKLGGQFDVLEGSTLSDYKITSVYAKDGKIEWENQLNVYAWLIEKVKKVPVTSVGIVALIRDWKSREAATKEGYPEAPIKELPIKLWSFEEREAYISSRIAKHSACDFALETDGELPLCTPEEMWEKPTMYAVKKEGAVRAKSVHADKEEAEEALEKAGKGYILEVREGERTRCANFCQVRDFCEQWKAYNNGN